MNQDEFITSEQGITQISPELSRNEQMGFIDTLRDTQSQQNQQIAEQTRNLGSDVPYSHGGLGGSNYFLSRYQTPQVDNMVANLKTAAQQSALNTALKNYQENLKEKYNQAYRSAKKRAGAGGGGTTEPYIGGDIETETTGTTVPNVGLDQIYLHATTGKTRYDIMNENVARMLAELGVKNNTTPTQNNRTSSGAIIPMLNANPLTKNSLT